MDQPVEFVANYAEPNLTYPVSLAHTEVEVPGPCGVVETLG